MYTDSKWLEDQYLNKKLSSVQISELCHCNSQTIINWLRKFGIPVRSDLAGRIARIEGKRTFSPNGKICSGCKEFKSFNDFHKDKSRPDGYAYICKPCAALKAKKSTIQRREKVYAYQRTWSKQNPDKRRAIHYRWREKHPETWALAQKRWRDRHPEEAKANVKRWLKANKHKTLEYSQRRRSLVAKSSGSFTVEEFDALCAKYGSVCLKCGEKLPLTVDHVIPLSKGGSNTIDNIQPLCHRCNSQKNNKTIDYRSKL